MTLCWPVLTTSQISASVGYVKRSAGVPCFHRRSQWYAGAALDIPYVLLMKLSQKLASEKP